jgi:hypothetical protein
VFGVFVGVGFVVFVSSILSKNKSKSLSKSPSVLFLLMFVGMLVL